LHSAYAPPDGCVWCEIARLRAALETAQSDKAEAIEMARLNTEARIVAWLYGLGLLPICPEEIADRIERGDHRKDGE
jgi:hypothetical protein